MADQITLLDFVNGDTNYVQKLNTNNAALSTSINALESLLNSAQYSSINITYLLQAIFGSTVTRMRSTDYAQHTASGGSMSITGGIVWIPINSTIVGRVASSVLNFGALSAGLYYVLIDQNGGPLIAQVNDTSAIFSVTWDGTNFGSITPLGNALNVAAIAGLITPM